MRKGSKMNRTVKATVGLVAIAAMSLTGLAACGGSSADDGKGKVYFLNFKPEAADQWVALAKKYTDKTGVQVKVQTAASGTYEQTLKSELAKSDAPTIFQVNGPVGYQNWKGYTADLKDTGIYNELNNKNFKPEAADQWVALAKKYTDKTGVQVKVQTAASGTYEQTLKSELAKSDAPTIFQVNGPVGYQNWKGYTADLKDTGIYNELNNKDIALKDGDKVVGIPYVMETYGIIYNKDLLKKYTELPGAKIKDVKEIDSFDKLKEVADDMQAKKDQLGIKGAFTSAGFDSSSDWRFKTHLANIPLSYEFKEDGVTTQPETIKGTYLPNFKNIFDLYLKDSTTAPSQLSSKTGDDAQDPLGEHPALL